MIRETIELVKKENGHAYVQAYEYIRDRILNGELERGTKLVEERLAEEIELAGRRCVNPFVSWNRKGSLSKNVS